MGNFFLLRALITIELFCCVKDIDLCIYWSLITMRKKSTSEMMKLSLNFETIGTGLPSD